MHKLFKQVIIAEEGNPTDTTGIVVFNTDLGKARFHRHHQTKNEWWSDENPDGDGHTVEPTWYLKDITNSKEFMLYRDDIPELTDFDIKEYKTKDFRAVNNRESFEAGMIHYRNWLKDTLLNG